MKYGLIGEHLQHSYSATIHGLFYLQDYKILELQKEDLVAFLKARDFDGLNVTIPYKEMCMAHLDNIDARAKRIGAVNTIVHRDHQLIGYNTDYDGFLSTVQRMQWQLKAATVLVLGTGGTSKTVKVVLEDQEVKKIYFASRDPHDEAVGYHEIDRIAQEVDYIVNTTPYGMAPHFQDKPLFSLEGFPRVKGVIDVIFNPFRTPLLIEAKRYKIPYCNGLWMLITQALYAEQLFLQKTFPLSMAETVYRTLFYQKVHFIFIGMPCSGKSTASKNIALLLHKERIDIDEQIEAQERLTVREIFEKKGEAYFREIESQMIEQTVLQPSKVIALGGGSLLDQRNCLQVNRHGFILFLNRDLALLKERAARDTTRPLLQKEHAIETLFQERYVTYRDLADVIIRNNGSRENTVQKIVRKLP